MKRKQNCDISRKPFVFLTAAILIRQSILFILNLLFPPLGEPVFLDILNRFEAVALRIQTMNIMDSLLSISLLVFFLWTLWDIKDVLGNPSVGVLKKVLRYYVCTIAVMFVVVGLFSVLDPLFQGEYFYPVWNICFLWL